MGAAGKIVKQGKESSAWGYGASRNGLSKGYANLIVQAFHRLGVKAHTRDYR